MINERFGLVTVESIKPHHRNDVEMPFGMNRKVDAADESGAGLMFRGVHRPFNAFLFTHEDGGRRVPRGACSTIVMVIEVLFLAPLIRVE